MVAKSSIMYNFEPKMWLRHPNYDLGTKANDIALIYCPINTRRSKNVAIGYFYLQDLTDTGVFTASYLNQIVEVAGWGKTESEIRFLDIFKFISESLESLAKNLQNSIRNLVKVTIQTCC